MSDERFILKNARHLAARYMEEILRPGDVAVDATMGNGKDTQFLCELVGETGRVYAFDVQEEALERTAARLEAAGLRARATLILAGHETMRENVPVLPRAVVNIKFSASRQTLLNSTGTNFSIASHCFLVATRRHICSNRLTVTRLAPT